VTSPRIATLTMNPALDLSTATERVLPEHKLRCEDPRYHPGGGGINVARAVVRLGGDALAVYPSGGPNGDLVDLLMGQEQVPCHVVPVAAWTRENVTVREQSTGAHYRFVVPGPALSAAAQDDCLAALASLVPQPGFVVLSGSLPPGTATDLVDRVSTMCVEMGARLVVDMSGEPLTRVRGAALMKASLSELSGLVGRPLETAAARLAAARQVVEQGRAEVLVLSLGVQGALLVTPDTARRFTAPSVPVRTTVGAGDAMLAGVLVGLTEGRDLAAAVGFGVAAGSAALLHPGTPLCSREDTDRLAPEVGDGFPAA
jgi:6-phosphofructokinase 2